MCVNDGFLPAKGFSSVLGGTTLWALGFFWPRGLSALQHLLDSFWKDMDSVKGKMRESFFD